MEESDLEPPKDHVYDEKLILKENFKRITKFILKAKYNFQIIIVRWGRV